MKQLNTNQKLKVIEEICQGQYQDETRQKEALVFASKSCGISQTEAANFLNVSSAYANRLFNKFDKNSTYEEVKALIIECTIKIYR